jgi:trigger factor
MSTTMDITKQQIDDLNAVVKVRVKPEDYESKVEKTLREHARKVSMPGFRPGKVPFGMVKKMYGKSVMVEEINKLLSDSLFNYLNEEKLEILGNPIPSSGDSIDWDNDKEFEFSYEIGLAPKFDIKLNKDIKFDFHIVQPDEDLLNKQIDDTRRRYGKMSTPEVAEASDILYGEFAELNEEGEVKEGGIFKSSTIVIERLKDEDTKSLLTGMKLNDTVDLNSKGLSDNPTDLAAMLGIDKEQAESLDVRIRFTLKSISRIEPAELNQEFFDKVYGEGNVTTEEEFRKRVEEDIKNMFKGDIDNRLYNDISTYLIDNANITLPDEFLKRWMQTASERPVTIEQIDADYPNYTRALKWQLIENKLIKENDVKVTEEEVVDYTKSMIREQFGRYGQMNIGEEDLNSYAQRMLKNKEEVKKVYDRLYDQKLIELFKNTFTLNEKRVSIDEFYGTSKKD